MRRIRIPAWSAVVLAVIALTLSACSQAGSAGGGWGPVPFAALARPADLRDRGRRAASEPLEASSPTAVALLTEAVQVCGARLGWVNPAIYAAYKAHGERPNFIDVTSGSNGYFGSTGFDAKAGYDNVSGIGMSNGITFARALCPSRES